MRRGCNLSAEKAEAGGLSGAGWTIRPIGEFQIQ